MNSINLFKPPLALFIVSTVGNDLSRKGTSESLLTKKTSESFNSKLISIYFKFRSFSLSAILMSLELPEAKYSIEDSIVEKSYFKNPVSIIFFKFKSDFISKHL